MWLVTANIHARSSILPCWSVHNVRSSVWWASIGHLVERSASRLIIRGGRGLNPTRQPIHDLTGWLANPERPSCMVCLHRVGQRCMLDLHHMRLHHSFWTVRAAYLVCTSIFLGGTAVIRPFVEAFRPGSSGWPILTHAGQASLQLWASWDRCYFGTTFQQALERSASRLNLP